MAFSIVDFLKARLQGDPPLRPIERQMAKRWVKERLKTLYPELRSDPRALEEAYQALSLEPREGTGKGGGTIFEVILPGHLD